MKCWLLCLRNQKMFVKPLRLTLTAKNLKSFLEITKPNTTINNNGLPSILHVRCVWTLRQEHFKCDRLISVKNLHTGSTGMRKKNLDAEEEFDEQNSLLYNGEFERSQSKNKASFLEVIRIYKANVKTTGGHVDFIKAALRHMKEFGVHQDITAYKKLLDVFPKGKYTATNTWLAEFMYYPRQQFVTLELLEQMEMNGLEPDKELLIILETIFGRLSHPFKKAARNLYWYTKLKNKSPFYSPKFLPDNALLLAKIAVERMTRVDLQSIVSVYNTESVTDSVDKTWIVNGQSPKQKELLAKHPSNQPVIVEGSELIWLKDKPVNYFTLKADCDPFPYYPEDKDDISNMESMIFNPNYSEKKNIERSVHEQDDGIIYAVCVTGTSSRDSLLSWVRILQSTGNPILAKVPVLFKFKTPETLPAPFSDELVQKEKMDTATNETNK